MTDIADQASEIEQENLRIAFLARKQAERPQATGYCLNALCQDDLEQYGQLFCSRECAMEYEKGRRR